MSETPEEKLARRRDHASRRGTAEKMPGRCGAKIPYSDPPRYCANHPCKGGVGGRCKFHGGMSLTGSEHPHWKGRGWSKHLPQRLADTFLKTLDDPELTSLASELGLLDAHMGELIERLSLGNHVETWEAVDDAIRELRHALEDGKQEAALQAAEKLQDFIQQEQKDRSTWAEIHHTIEQRRRLSDTERRREELLSATMTAKQTMMFVAALQQAINDEITDQDSRRRIAGRMRNLLASNMNVGTPMLSSGPADGEAP